MFPVVIPLALGGAVVASVLLQRKKRSLRLPESKKREARLDGEATVLPVQEVGKRRLLIRLLAAEQHYQAFVHRRIDPMFGRTRQQYLQEFRQNDVSKLGQEERYANLRIGIGGGALMAALLGRLVYAPLMGVAILLGGTVIATFYYIAYLEWRRTRRLGSIHLTCVYDAFLWTGGYATFGALGMFLLGIGLKIKAMNESRSQDNLTGLFQLQPDKVWVRIDGGEMEIPFEELLVGDVLVLRGGQVTPVDGTIISGIATLDQHMLTGESQPVEKTVGETLMASTVLITGEVDVLVERTGSETTAGQLGKILNQTAKYNTDTALKVMRASDRLTWPTLALSVGSAPFIGAMGAVSVLGANSTFNTYVTGSVVVLNFLNQAAENGVLIKDGKALEELDTVDMVVFDKTGTLTMDQPGVGRIHAFADMSETLVLALAAAAEVRQTHPVACAILAAARTAELDLPVVSDTHYEQGFGIKVKLKDDARILRVGSYRFMRMEGVTLPENREQLMTASDEQGHSLVMVGIGDQVVGCIELYPTIRPEAQGIIHSLQDRGVEVCIISGDQEGPTRQLALQCGVEKYFANVLPEGKADLVSGFQAEGRSVCFIGDGINDAVAMRKANVSISLRGATTAATDTAQVILMDGGLGKLPVLFLLAQQFRRRLGRNFRFTAGVSLMALSGILLAGFSFAATEILYAVSLLGGLGIAMQPSRQAHDESTQKPSAN